MKKIPRTNLIIIAAVISILLYFAGVLSGLYANTIIKAETQESLLSLKNYVDLLDTNLKSIQMEQTFAESLNHEQKCSFSSISMNNLISQLGEYWKRLPFRIEEYEKQNELSQEYLALKQEYTQLSIRTWIHARNAYYQCNTSLVPVLYFYSSECKDCLEQGKQLDILQKNNSNGSKIMVFTVDMDSDELIVKSIKEYYNLISAPAIIADNATLQGRVISYEELASIVK